MEPNRNNAFHALDDPTRRAILSLLSGCRMPAGRIARRFPQRRPAISKHLTLLKRAGLISERRSGQQRLYAIRPEALTAVLEFLAGLQPPPPDKPATPATRAAPDRPAPTRRPRRSRPTFELEFD